MTIKVSDLLIIMLLVAVSSFILGMELQLQYRG
jgi:hypothetical protein